MIIDVHVHLVRYAGTRFARMKMSQVRDALLKEMEASGVDMAFILAGLPEHAAPDSKDFCPETAETLALVKGINTLKVLGTIDVLRYRKRDLDELDEYLRKRLVIGIKLYPGYQPVYPSDKRCHPIYRLAVKHDVPVLFHSGDTFDPESRLKYAHPLNLDDVAVDFPDLKIIIAHAGNPWMVDTAELLYKHKNVYADISGLGKFVELDTPDGELAKRRLQDLMAYSSPRKLLYGTDWALVPMKSYLKFARSLGIGKNDLEYVFSKNARALFGVGA